MSRYIDRAYLFNALSTVKTLEEAFEKIQNAPSAEVDRLLVVKLRCFVDNIEVVEELRKTLKRQMDDGKVILLPPHVEFCELSAWAGSEPVRNYVEITSSEMRDNLYPCDPDKADRCKKTACYRNGGECRLTTHEEWRQRRDDLK